MKKYSTFIANYKFNSIMQGPRPITWYVLEKSEDLSYEYGRCFTGEELNDFQQFVLAHPGNFPGDKNYIHCRDEDDTIFPGRASALLPNNRLTSPEFIVLSQNPRENYNGNILRSMDVVLYNNMNQRQHDYNLEFSVIGQFNDN